MTAVLEAPLTPGIGSLTPRKFTPPLEHHCTGPKSDPFIGGPAVECPCGCGLNPETSWGFDCNRFAERVLGWQLLPYQQWLNIHALEKGDKDGGFRFKILVVLIARQQGKALDRATPMLTTDGWSTMGNLKVGDEVFHPDGTPTRVLGAFDQPGGRTCYEVTSTDGRSIVADAEHLWTVQDVRRYTRKGRAGERPVRTYSWETLTTAELLERGLVRDKRGRERAFRLPVQEAIQSKPIDLPIDPYILGAWLGDGTSRSSNISSGDEDVSETINNLLAAGAQLVSVKREKTCWKLRINVGAGMRGGGMRDGFEARCRKLGIWGAKAIPDQYLTAGTEQRLAMLQGLLDTDGHITAAGQVEFSSTSRNIIDGAHYLARSLGFRPGLVCEGVSRLRGRDYGPKYRFRFTPDNGGLIPFRMIRKVAQIKDHPLHNRGRQIVSIASIREVPSRPVRCIKVDRDDGQFLAGRDLMPTHNTAWLRQLGLWRLFMNSTGKADSGGPGAKLALIAAQNLMYAEGVLKEVVDEIRDNKLLGKELINHRVTNGNHRAILTNRRYWRAATASRKGGRSLSVDIAMLDELREHTTTDAWDAITPTTLVRPFSQIVCTSNAGDQRSEVLRAQRDAALRRITSGETADTKTALFEWSVPEEADPSDETYWHMANPALGHLNDFTLVDLRAQFESMQYRNLPGFMTEHLCMWVNALEPGIMSAEHWAETTQKISRRAVGSPVYAALDVNYDRSRSHIAIASRRADGNLHIEIVISARGTDWVIPWLTGNDDAGVSRKKKFVGVAVQKTGAPVSGMMDDLKAAGIKVVEWGPGVEVTGGCGLLYDQINEHKIYHKPSPVLDRAAASGVPRYVGEGWVFSRRDSPVDVSPLIACAAAAWLEHQAPARPPEIHAWPSEETIAAWEAEADEKFPALSGPAHNVLDDIQGDAAAWWTK